MAIDDPTVSAVMPAAPARAPLPGRDRLLRWVVFIGYLALVLLAAAHHEMWRDEVRALLIAREGTLADLFRELHAEGHPAVWYLLLRMGYALTRSQLILPALSAAVAAAAVYLLLRFSPFSWVEKILLVLGVFPLFEYSVMARNYGLGMLLIIILAILYPTRFQRPIVWGLLLALMANTSAHAAVIAVAIAAGTAWDAINMRRQMSARQLRKIVAGALVVVGGILAARATVSTNQLPAEPAGMPRAQTVVHQMALAGLNPGRQLGALLPSPFAELGNSERHLRTSGLQDAAVDLILIGMVIALWGQWSLLLILVIGVTGTQALFRTVYGANLRHIGLIWFLFVLLYWQAKRLAESGDGTMADRRRLRFAFTYPIAVGMLLQAVEGVRRVGQDIREPWSSGKALATVLARPEYENAIVLATDDHWLETLSYYINRRFYFHSQRRFETFTHNTRPFFGRRTLPGFFSSADTVKAGANGPVLLLVSDSDMVRATPADSAWLRARATEVAALNHVIGDESYHVLKLRDATGGGAEAVPR